MGGLIDAIAEALREVPAWVVHAGHQDLRILHHVLGGLPLEVLDTQLADGLSARATPRGSTTCATTCSG